jgi:hypothetical protein
MAESKRIQNCCFCFEEYCRNCSDSSYPDDYCSKECEEKAAAEDGKTHGGEASDQ